MSVIVVDFKELRQIITDHFSISDLQTLCFDLGIDYEDLHSNGKTDFARKLIEHCKRNGRVKDLLDYCIKVRPHIEWNIIAPIEDSDSSPYKGLISYDVHDAHLFFGRDVLTNQLATDLLSNISTFDNRQDQFLCVVGASGSGKSSVIRAGLIPAIANGRVLGHSILPAQYTKWPIHLITPDVTPLKQLALSLTRDVASFTAASELIQAMQKDASILDMTVQKMLYNEQADHLVLIIDQFEELFTHRTDETERLAFIDNLITAVSAQTAGPTVVVIALRADFYHHCGKYEPLRQLIAQNQKYIGPMTQEELYQVITEPARKAGLQLEEGLTERMLSDVGHEPGRLPLLSHALHETWRRQKGKMLTFQGYQAAGGVETAITKTADSFFDKLPPIQQEITRNILLRLTAIGEGIEPTRRRVNLDDLILLQSDEKEIHAVLHKLSVDRLITLDVKTVEVAHESLIREWPKLRNWLKEEKEEIQLRQHLQEAAKSWELLNREDGGLYRGVRLVLLTEWVKENKGKLNELELEFFTVSQTAARVEEKTKQINKLRQSSLMGLLGGAIGFSFSALLLNFNIKEAIIEFWVFYFFIAMVPGGFVGFLFTVMFELFVEQRGNKEQRERVSHKQWLIGGAIGIIVFAIALTLLAFPPAQYHNLDLSKLEKVVADGAIWGFVAGIGSIWVVRNTQKAWQTIPIVSVICGMTFWLISPTLDMTFVEEKVSVMRLIVAGIIFPLCMITAMVLSRTKEGIS